MVIVSHKRIERSPFEGRKKKSNKIERERESTVKGHKNNHCKKNGISQNDKSSNTHKSVFFVLGRVFFLSMFVIEGQVKLVNIILFFQERPFPKLFQMCHAKTHYFSFLFSLSLNTHTKSPEFLSFSRLFPDLPNECVQSQQLQLRNQPHRHR